MAVVSSIAALLRPRWPGADDKRAELQENICRVLFDDWDELLTKWLEKQIGPERAASWGPVDTTINTFSALCSQLSTPGHYQYRPEIRNADARADLLTGVDVGMLDRALWGPLMQHVEYSVLGAGDWFIRPHVTNDGLLALIDVPPFLVRKICDQNDKRRIVWLEWLRPRLLQRGNAEWEVWTIERYDIREGKTPSYDIRLAAGGPPGSVVDEDLTAELVGPHPDGGGWSGDHYPYRRADNGRLFIPFGWWSSQVSGADWQVFAGRGGFRGALQAALLNTYTNRSAMDASGSTVLLVNVAPPAATVKNAQGPGMERTMALRPGSMVFFAPMENAVGQPLIQQIGPGANLNSLAAYATSYEVRLMARAGLSPSDVTRASGNDSAQGLMVKDSGRRRYSMKIRPLLRAGDLQFFEIIASLCRIAGLDVPESGYSITYRDIPDSPEEERQRRESEKSDRENGLISTVDMWRARHPGSTDKDAVAALAKVRADELSVDKALQELLPDDDDLVPSQLDTARAQLIQAVVADAQQSKIGRTAARALLITVHGLAAHVADAMLPEEEAEKPTEEPATPEPTDEPPPPDPEGAS